MASPQFFDLKTILLKEETTYGQDAAPTGGANGILALNGTFDPNPQTVLDRRLIRPFFGNPRRPTSGRHVGLTFDIEIAGTGITPPSTPPQYGPALRAVGLAETIVPTPGDERVEYDPISSGYESATVYFNMDGVEHRMLGVRGNLELVYVVGEVPVYRLSCLGLHVDPTEVAMPTVSFSGFREPQTVEMVNTPTFTVDGFSASLQSLNVNMQQAVFFQQRLNAEEIHIGRREPVATMVIEAPSLAQKDFFSLAKQQAESGAPLSALQLVHGTVTGDIVEVNMPAVQLINPRYVDIQGITHLEIDLNPTPVTGNDEIKITVK